MKKTVRSISNYIAFKPAFIIVSILVSQAFLWCAFLDTQEFPLGKSLFNDSLGNDFKPSTIEFEKASMLNSSEFSKIFALAAAKPSTELSHLKLIFVTYGGEPAKAEFSISSEKCDFDSKANEIKDNTWVEFKPKTGCTNPVASELTNLEIKVKVSGPLPANYKLGVWARAGPKTPKPPFLKSIETNKTSNLEYFAIGSVLEELPLEREIVGSPKVERLAFLWNLSKHWKTFAAALSGLLIFGVCGLFLSLQMGASRLKQLLVFATSSLCLLVAWALLTPPLQAPDEPDHLLSYSKLNSRPSKEAVIEFAKKTHFERIKFRTDEKFLSKHRQSEFGRHWRDHVKGPDAQRRSPIARHYWKAAGIVASAIRLNESADHVPYHILLIRLLNCFMIALTASFALSLYIGLNARSPIGMTTLIGLPSILFFSMHISNYVFLIMGYIILFGILQSFHNRQSHWQLATNSIAILLFSSLTLLGGSIGLLYCFLGCALIILTSSRYQLSTDHEESHTSLRASAVITATTLFSCLVLPQLFSNLFPLYEGLKRDSLPVSFTTLNISAIVALMLYFALIYKANQAPEISQTKSLLFRRLLVFSTLALLILSLVIPSEGLHDIETSPLSWNLYLADAVKSAIQTGFFGFPDFYLASSFWSGFGWLETLWNPAVTKALQLILSAGLVFALLESFKPKKPSLLLNSFAILFTLVGTFLVLAFAYHQKDVNLHGRYLIGYYTTLIGYSFFGWQRFVSTIKWPNGLDLFASKKTANHLFFALLTCLQTYAMFFLMHRYF